MKIFPLIRSKRIFFKYRGRIKSGQLYFKWKDGRLPDIFPEKVGHFWYDPCKIPKFPYLADFRKILAVPYLDYILYRGVGIIRKPLEYPESFLGPTFPDNSNPL